MPHLEIAVVVLVRCNVANSNYQCNSRALYKFIRNKWFDQLLRISHKNLLFLKIFESKFSYVKVWFSDESARDRR